MWSIGERGAWGNVEHWGTWSKGDVKQGGCGVGGYVEWGVVWSGELCGVGGCVEWGVMWSGGLCGVGGYVE